MTWEMQVGDPARFAMSLAFTKNPDGAEDTATPEEQASWGSVKIWAGGENLCAHHELGEVINACHWYLLPLIEWFAANWDALFHEERLPLRNERANAAAAMSSTKLPPPSIGFSDELDWLSTWAQWWERHNIRAARNGGLLPDVYIRRFRDQIELSSGSEPLPGIPAEFLFLARDRTHRLDVKETSAAIYDVLLAAALELRKQLPASTRIGNVVDKIRGLTDSQHRVARLAYLAGFGENRTGFDAIREAVEDVFTAQDNIDLRSEVLRSDRDDNLVTVGSAYARLLFGSFSPEVTTQDVATLTASLIRNHRASTSMESLIRLGKDLTADVGSLTSLTPGEQGSLLGDRASEAIADLSTTRIDVAALLDTLGVNVSEVQLSDTELRAISVIGETQSPHVYHNANYRWGDREAVRRFTLAHELCHLLMDREFSNELAVASGPWAPFGIEQRANAFAAAFLMPTRLLQRMLANNFSPVSELSTVKEMAHTLGVSRSTLIDRLHNLGEITREQRAYLRDL